MRLTGLELAPFGHFAYSTLEFVAPVAGPGVHVIRGRNGAGKSTTMRALDGALFGFPRRTADAHTHLAQTLKVGLVIEMPDGRLLRVERRKRDGQSLFAPDGTPVDEAVLREALGGLPREEFRSMFLLDCDELEAGSEELLAGHGLLGQALFGAALGFARVHTTLAEIENEAQALWVKGGTRELNRQIKALNTARQEKRHQRFDPDELACLQRELEDTVKHVHEVKHTQTEITERLQRTIRHEACMAPLAQRKQLLEELEALPPLPELPNSFADDVAAAQTDLANAETLIADTTDELDRVTAELDANPEPGPIADSDTAVNALYQRAGASAKAASDLPRREADLTMRSAELNRLLALAGLPQDTDSVDPLRISAADRARLEELIGDRGALDQADESAKQAVARLTRQVDDLHRAKPAVPIFSEASREGLNEAVEAARAEGDLNTRAASARTAAADHSGEAERACEALPIWGSGVGRLERLAVPNAASVQRFEHELAVLWRETDRIEHRRTELAERAARVESEGHALAVGPRAPSRAEVTDAREHRDRAVLAFVRNPDAENAADVSSSVSAADQLADARADHAENAAEHDRIERDLASLEGDQTRLESDENDHQLAVGEYQQRWAAAWPELGADPLPPAEMREWLTARTDILETARKARDQNAAAEEAERAIEEHRQALTVYLGYAADPGSPLKRMLQQAAALLSEDAAARSVVAQHERDVKRLAGELRAAQDTAAQAEAALVKWAADWKPIVGTLGLGADASPAQARAQLNTITDLLASFDGVAELRRRIQSLREDEASFAADAHALASELSPDLIELTPPQIAEKLHARAAAARSIRATREQLEPQQRKLARQATAADTKRTAATDRLTALAARAGVDVDELDELDELCVTVERHGTLTLELRSVEKELVAAGAASVSDLVAELNHATPESLAAARAEDETEREALGTTRSALDQRAGALREKLAAGGASTAALAAEQEAQARAALRDGYDRYTELTLAAALLRAAIEEHRKQNEGPLLKRAGELFARLSGGSMIGLTILTTEKEPHIMGVLPDHRQVPVEGMSTGQRHQLFLALRLASLERHFEHNEPMPLILDDLLVQFDDTSARAALEIVAELSRTVQVLFFTHHDHLVEMARDVIPADLLVEHQVGETARPALQAA